ncbi:hypothetical protein [Litorihabitans aurantiacus]|uniref:PH domain-containing protein n=1 Tax=Litorihabitans aurantiacus TaxID=1930061 RepID=A0AA37UJ68_9MICO|nr:hypothetical protein [Litorihabitans aurantiacus]GMA30115.1 hypothetical protein GCM10025875_01070 [Litorihabitans aurantiacus]
MSEVIARQQPQPRWLYVMLFLYTAILARWVGAFFDLPWYWAAAVAAVVMASGTWLVHARTTTALVVTPDAMVLRRRLRPRTIDRTAILAVRTDVPGRPTWSSQVLIDTTDGTIELPRFDEPTMAEIVQRLQDWSGTADPEEAPEPPRTPSGGADERDGSGGFSGPIYLG